MNRYEKKKNILQAMLEIECIKSVFKFMKFIIVPFLLGFPVLKIPYILNKVASMNVIEYTFITYLVGLTAMFIIYLGYLCILFVAEIVKPIRIGLYAAKIMQYLPLSVKDWERFGAKTDEEAVLVLRDLVKTVGYCNNLKKCYELRDQIADSYRAFLVFKYGKDATLYTVTFHNVSALVLCPDEDFDELLNDELLKNTHDDCNPRSII